MSNKSNSKTWIIAVTFVVITIVAAGFWMLSPVTVVADVTASREFQADCQYNVFRQILVRTNATKAIVENGGMKLLDEETKNIQLDTSADRRPILNAIRGKSKSELDAVKIITVELTDPQLKAEKLKLKQQADINNDALEVATDSIEAAGNLKKYQSHLAAQSQQDKTQVKMNVAMKVQISVPRIFAGTAQSEVQEAANQGLAEQEEALKTLIAEHGDSRIILPNLD